MSKGSLRRPGAVPPGAWEAIFKKQSATSFCEIQSSADDQNVTAPCPVCDDTGVTFGKRCECQDKHS